MNFFQYAFGASLLLHAVWLILFMNSQQQASVASLFLAVPEMPVTVTVDKAADSKDKVNTASADANVATTPAQAEVAAADTPVVPLNETSEAAMRRVCEQVRNDPNADTQLAIIPQLFCEMYPLVYKRAMTQQTDRLRTHYKGKHAPDHYQMAYEQYLAIVSIILTLPPNPRILIFGCGADTPIYHKLVHGYLDGTVDFVDDNEEWAKVCVEKGAHHVHVVQYPSHTGHLKVDHLAKLKQVDGHATPLNDPVYQMEYDLLLPESILQAAPYDVIVVDGPPGAQDQYQPGRSEALFWARRLAESYALDHYTHVFLHDTNRGSTALLGHAILGTHPSTYLGNVRPTKGLMHWRLGGREAPLASQQQVPPAQ